MCDLDFQFKGQRSRSRDLQVTLQVTFHISGSMPGGTMLFFVSNVFWVKEVDGVRKKYVTFTRDLVLQGHAT